MRLATSEFIRRFLIHVLPTASTASATMGCSPDQAPGTSTSFRALIAVQTSQSAAPAEARETAGRTEPEGRGAGLSRAAADGCASSRSSLVGAGHATAAVTLAPSGSTHHEPTIAVVPP